MYTQDQIHVWSKSRKFQPFRHKQLQCNLNLIKVALRADVIEAERALIKKKDHL